MPSNSTTPPPLIAAMVTIIGEESVGVGNNWWIMKATMGARTAYVRLRYHLSAQTISLHHSSPLDRQIMASMGSRHQADLFSNDDW